MEPLKIREVIDEIRSLTEMPFAMNLWVSMEDKGAFTSDAKVPAFSFVYGVPSTELLDECKRLGIILIGTATTVDEAKVLEDAGVDLVVASGFEAGGHRGSFLRPAEDSLMGTMSLVPQMSDAVSLPVIAAGGIADARGVIAAFALGAEAVQMGTVFLATEESGASKLHRKALLSGKAAVTGLTRGFTGRLARGIKSEWMDELNSSTEILPYPLQRHLIRNLSIAAERAGNEARIPMWSGQSAGLIQSTDVKSMMDALVRDVSEPANEVLCWKSRR